MIIAIDGYEANVATRVGIGRYAYEILKHLWVLLDPPTARQADVSVRVYLPSAPLPSLPKETPWWQYRVVGPKKFWTFIGLPWAVLRDYPHADIVFSPTHYIPRFISQPRVFSIMDLSYLYFPELFRKKDLHQLTNWTRYSVRHAAHILTISEWSKNAILEAYKVKPAQVSVTYPGITPLRGDISMSFEEVGKTYGISKHYILSVGTLQPRKNYVRLIESFALFLSQNKQKFSSLQLVIVGKRGWLYEDILATPARLGLSERVKFLDFVPDEVLPILYKHALCFALPSLYEGFGLPVAEAMQESCPVVVSNVSSLPEVAGKAGIYIDPEDVKSIAQGLLKAVRERNLMQGKARIKAGLIHVKKFTWESAARQTLEVLTEVGGTT